MEIEKLNRMRDTSKFYKLLLDYFSSPLDKDYELTDEQVAIFQDEELYNQFSLDLVGRIILLGEEENSGRAPDKFAFEKVFNVESSIFSDRKEQMKQIRNCFAHSLTQRESEDAIRYDNGKISGTASIESLRFVSALYSDFEEIKTAIIEKNRETHAFDEEQLKKLNPFYLSHISELLSKRVLAGSLVTQPMKTEKELDGLLEKAKTVWVKGKDIKETLPIALGIYNLSIGRGAEHMTPSALKKLFAQNIPGGDKVEVKSLYDMKASIKAFIDYLGVNNFYGTDLKTQQDIITTAIALEDRGGHNRAVSLTSTLLALEKLKQDISKGERSFDLSKGSNSELDYLSHRYNNPAKYEYVLQAYMYNRLVYLKELLNTNQIDESVLDYSKVDISDIDVNIRYSKKDVAKRKAEIGQLIESCKKRIEEQKNAREKEAVKRPKMDNPKNPKREEQLATLDAKLAQKDQSIAEEQRLLRQYEEEREYIASHNKLPVKQNALFRILRNSTTHGFSIGGRQSAYKAGNLERLMVYFEDNDPKATVNMTVERMLKLIQDIESVVIENVEQISKTATPLSDAIEHTESTVSETSLTNTASNVARHRFKEERQAETTDNTKSDAQNQLDEQG